MNLCAPALIYIIFSISQIIIDAFQEKYNMALIKLFIAVLFTMLLEFLCQRGLGIVSWIIVFVPFILMSVLTRQIKLIVFGLDSNPGNILYVNKNKQIQKKKEESSYIGTNQEKNNKMSDISKDSNYRIKVSTYNY